MTGPFLRSRARSARRLIYTLRQYPNTEDFVYLRRLDRNPSDYNPYALEVVPFSDLNPNDFYVLSVRGITHHLDGESPHPAASVAGQDVAPSMENPLQ